MYSWSCCCRAFVLSSNSSLPTHWLLALSVSETHSKLTLVANRFSDTSWLLPQSVIASLGTLLLSIIHTVISELITYLEGTLWGCSWLPVVE